MSTAVRAQHSAGQWEQRVDSGDWDAITAEVNEHGGTLLPRLLTVAETETIRSLYRDDANFRATVNMSRHRSGSGEYRYFELSYPEPVERLKQALYPRLLPIARDWHAKLGRPAPWPDTLDEWLRMCHAAGQNKPTAILLRYGQGDWNALHRDLYGDLVFPLQVVINLSEPGTEHTLGLVFHDAAVTGHKAYTLLGADGRPYQSASRGQLGGHRRSRIYGRLDCPAALRAIARGGYTRHRVFFADEPTAIAAGYRPCATCCPGRYQQWKNGPWRRDP